MIDWTRRPVKPPAPNPELAAKIDRWLDRLFGRGIRWR